MNVKKEKFYQYSLIIIGLFWVLFGYIHLKYHIVHRIWAVIDAPYNYFALPEFFSYDALPILAVIFTGASFVLYSSILLKNVTKNPLKWFVYIILWLIIFAGCLRFVPILCHLGTKTYSNRQKIQQWSEWCETLSLLHLRDFCRDFRSS